MSYNIEIQLSLDIVNNQIKALESRLAKLAAPALKTVKTDAEGAITSIGNLGKRIGQELNAALNVIKADREQVSKITAELQREMTTTDLWEMNPKDTVELDRKVALLGRERDLQDQINRIVKSLSLGGFNAQVAQAVLKTEALKNNLGKFKNLNTINFAVVNADKKLAATPTFAKVIVENEKYIAGLRRIRGEVEALIREQEKAGVTARSWSRSLEGLAKLPVKTVAAKIAPVQQTIAPVTAKSITATTYVPPTVSTSAISLLAKQYPRILEDSQKYIEAQRVIYRNDQAQLALDEQRKANNVWLKELQDLNKLIGGYDRYYNAAKKATFAMQQPMTKNQQEAARIYNLEREKTTLTGVCEKLYDAANAWKIYYNIGKVSTSDPLAGTKRSIGIVENSLRGLRGLLNAVRGTTTIQVTSPGAEKLKGVLLGVQRVIRAIKTDFASARQELGNFSAQTSRATGQANMFGSVLGTWWQHFGRVAIGFTIAYRAMNAFGALMMKTTDTIREAVRESGELAALTGKLTMFTQMYSKGTISYDQALKQSTATTNSLMAASVKSTSSIRELGVALDETAQAGVLLGPEVMEKFVSFVDFTALISQNGQDMEKQLRSEINALMEGQTRANNTLIRTMKSMGIIDDIQINSLRKMGDREKILLKIMDEVHKYWTQMRDNMIRNNPSIAYDMWEKSIRRVLIQSIQLAGQVQKVPNIIGSTIKDRIDKWNKMFEVDPNKLYKNIDVQRMAVMFQQIAKGIDLAMNAFEHMILGAAKLGTAIANLSPHMKTFLKYLLAWEATVITMQVFKILAGFLASMNTSLIGTTKTFTVMRTAVTLSAVSLTVLAASIFGLITVYDTVRDSNTKFAGAFAAIQFVLQGVIKYLKEFQSEAVATGGLVGAIFGALIGTISGHPILGALLGGAAGSGAGALADKLIPDPTTLNARKEALNKAIDDINKKLSDYNAQIVKLEQTRSLVFDKKSKEEVTVSISKIIDEKIKLRQLLTTKQQELLALDKPQVTGKSSGGTDFFAEYMAKLHENAALFVNGARSALGPVIEEVQKMYEDIIKPHINIDEAIDFLKTPFKGLPSKKGGFDAKSLEKEIAKEVPDLYDRYIKAVKDGDRELANIIRQPVIVKGKIIIEDNLEYELQTKINTARSYVEKLKQILSSGAAGPKGQSPELYYQQTLARINDQMEKIREWQKQLKDLNLGDEWLNLSEFYNEVDKSIGDINSRLKQGSDQWLTEMQAFINQALPAFEAFKDIKWTNPDMQELFNKLSELIQKSQRDLNELSFDPVAERFKNSLDAINSDYKKGSAQWREQIQAFIEWWTKELDSIPEVSIKSDKMRQQLTDLKDKLKELSREAPTALQAIKNGFDELASEDAVPMLQAAVVDLGKTFEDVFVNFPSQGKEAFHDMLSAIEADLIRFMSKKYFTSFLGEAGGYVTDLFSSFFSSSGSTETKKYAKGGVIEEHIIGYGLKSGKRYELGEEGDEIAIPVSGLLSSKTRKTSSSDSQKSSSSGKTEVHLHNAPANTTATAKTTQTGNNSKRIDIWLDELMANNILNPSKTSAALRTRGLPQNLVGRS